jgi:hypothetical protein
MTYKIFAFKNSILRLSLPIGLLFFLSGCIHSFGSFSREQLPKRMMAVDGATLDKIELEAGNLIYIQTIDLHKIAIDQLIGEIDSKQGAKGFYYLNDNNIASPFFARNAVASVRHHYQQRYGSKQFSMMNGSFFEDYQSSTRLSFPIKLNGKLISSGSSPYGPTEKPADPYYQKIQLKALTWDQNTAKISDYNPLTGYPFNQASVTNGLVSYLYQDHPAYVLADDPENRYHVLGVSQNGADESTNRLLIATANRTTLKKTAAVLRQLGVKGDLLTIDGGISTYLWNIKSGDLVLPKAAPEETEAALPHYLGFRSKH